MTATRFRPGRTCTTLGLVVLQERGLHQEALMLLVDSLAAMSTAPSSRAKRTAFSGHLEALAGRSSCSEWRQSFATELLRLFCEQQPAEATAVLDRYAPEVTLTLP